MDNDEIFVGEKGSHGVENTVDCDINSNEFEVDIDLVFEIGRWHLEVDVLEM